MPDAHGIPLPGEEIVVPPDEKRCETMICGYRCLGRKDQRHKCYVRKGK
jgi:hypothetical protein